MYYSTKKTYKADKSKWTAADEKKDKCDFFLDAESSWFCFEDKWMD